MDNPAAGVKFPAHFMKSNPLNSLLTVVLGISVMLSAVFCIQYTFKSRELRRLAIEVGRINTYRNVLQLLANDCAAYSEKNPAMNPILDSVGVKKTMGAPANNSAK